MTQRCLSGPAAASNSRDDIEPKRSSLPELTDSTGTSDSKKPEPLPNIDTKQLLPTIIDRLAETHPDVNWAMVPADPNSYDSGYRAITYAQLANAVNNAAWWLRTLFGHQAPDSQWQPASNCPLPYKQYQPKEWIPVIGLLGAWDPRTIMVTLALTKINASTFMLPASMPIDEMAESLRNFKCSTLLVASKVEIPGMHYDSVLKLLQKKYSVGVFVLPSLEELLEQPSVFYHDYEQAHNRRSDEALTHFVGKPTYVGPLLTKRYDRACTHRCVASWLEWIAQELRKSKGAMQRKRMFIMLQAHTVTFLILNLFVPVLAHSTAVFPLPSAQVSEQTLRNVLSATSFEILGAPGFILAAIAHKHDLLDHAKLSGVTTVAVVGQALCTHARDVLPEHFHSFTLCGSNPFLMNFGIVRDWIGEDWDPLVTKKGKNVDFEPLYEGKWWFSAGNMKRAVFKANTQDPWFPVEALKAFSWHTGIEATNDLYSWVGLGDESESRMWTFECETNEMMWTVKWGAIVNPLPLEQHMANHPLLKHAILVGKKLSRAVLLMQLRKPSEVEALKSTKPNFMGGLTELSGEDAQGILERNDKIEILDILGKEVDFCKYFLPSLRSIGKEYVALLEPEFAIPQTWEGKVDRNALSEMLEKAQQDCTMRSGARFRITEWFQMVSQYL